MTKTDPQDPDDGLTPYFIAARTQARPPSVALQARILADANAERDLRSRLRRQGAAGAGRSMGWREWLLGLRARRGPGVPSIYGAVATLGMAALAGLWLGIAAPGPFGALEAWLWGVAPLAALDAELAERAGLALLSGGETR